MEERKFNMQEDRRSRGQAIIEYALILALLALALAAILAVTGPAVGNVFSNTVYNLVGQDPETVADSLEEFGGSDNFWLTVTWVADPTNQIPQESNPDPDVAPPDEGGSEPTNTPLPTVATDTPVPTETIEPSVTPLDSSWSLPFYENVNDVDEWRLDDSTWLGGESWWAEFYPNSSFTPVDDGSGVPKPDIARWTWQLDTGDPFTSPHTLNLDYDWGTGLIVDTGAINWPSSSIDEVSIRYTRNIHVETEQTFIFTTRAAGSLTVSVGGTTVVNNAGGPTLDEGIQADDVIIPAGVHEVIVEYVDIGGNAGLSLDITEKEGKRNVDDVFAAGEGCTWGRIADDSASTLTWMFDENPGADLGGNRTCHLELRGRIDLSGAANPVLTFWDVWDFSGSGAEAYVEVAEYVADAGSGSDDVLDRAIWSGASVVPVHTSGTANYNWTRQWIDLSSFAGTEVTFRFIINNPGAAGNNRWYLDDVRLLDEPTAGTITVGELYPLDDVSAKADFITSERWDLSSEKSVGTLAWDDSPGYDYHNFNVAGGDRGTRVHYVELRDQIDLVETDGSPTPLTDAEGDDLDPQISFWHQFSIDDGTSLEVQYTTVPRNAQFDYDYDSSDIWTTIDDPATTATIEGQVALGSGATTQNSVMEKVAIPLTLIPGYDTTYFRLRFAMIVPDTANNDDSGWHIDNIYIERVDLPRFADYPFSDDVEDAAFSLDQWRFLGTFGTTVESGRYSGRSYTDSPNNDYLPNSTSILQMQYVWDMNNDTVAHLDATGGVGYPGGAADRPILRFWHWRDLSSSTSFKIDMYFADTDSWEEIWDVDYNEGNSANQRYNQQFAWELVEIDLAYAYEDEAGQTLADAALTAADDDDDIKIRFRFENFNSTVDDGVYVDDITVEDYEEDVWVLTDSGDGETFTEDFEGAWYDRWHYGGDWWGIDYDTRSGNRAMHESPDEGDDMTLNQWAMLEMKTWIDLTDVDSSDVPTLRVWMKRDIDEDRHTDMEVWIARENNSSSEGLGYNYDRLHGWENWDRIENSNWRNRAWHMMKYDLSGYAGDRIRIRFALDTSDTRIVPTDGWFIDDLSVEYNTNQRIFTLPFLDLAQSTSNWITEGDWGLAADRWKGSGGGPALVGFDQWDGAYLHCHHETGNRYNCGDNKTDTLLFHFQNLLDNYLTNGYAGFAEDLDVLGKKVDIYETTYPEMVHSYGSGFVQLGFTSDPRVTCWEYPSLDPPLARWSNCPQWDDLWVAHFERDIEIASAGTYTFSAIANEAVRVKIIGGDFAPGADDWNVINRWGPFDDEAKSETRTLNLEPGTYRLQLQWADRFNRAYLSFTISNNNFSFTDSPNEPNDSGGFDIVPSIYPRASYAIILDGVIDLTGTVAPLWEYYTLWELCTPRVDDPNSCQSNSNKGTAEAEVTFDGGFSWTDDEGTYQFRKDPVCVAAATDWTTCPNEYEDGDFNNIRSLDEGWQRRRHSLHFFVDQFVGIRYRVESREQFHDGLYITEIRVNE